MKIIKIFKVLFITIVVIIVMVVAGAFLFLKTYDINRLKPQIIQAINKASGLNVRIGKLAFKFSLYEGIIMNVSKISVGDVPEFSKLNFFEADAISFHVDILSLIRKKEIISSKIVIQSPRFNFIANDSGELNVEKILERITSAQQKNDGDVNTRLNREAEPKGRMLKKEAANSGQADVRKRKDLRLQESYAFPAISISSFKINDGEIIYKNRISHPNIVIPIRNINFDISNFALNKSFNFNLLCSLWSDSDNVKIQGNAIVNLPHQEVRLDDVLIVTDFEQLSFEKMKKDMRSLNTDAVKSCKQGKLSLLINQAILGDKGLLTLSADGNLADVRFDFQDNKFPINTFNSRFEVTEKDISIKELLIGLASGEIVFKGDINDYWQSQDYAFDLDINGIKLDELLSVEDVGYQITGVIKGDFHLKGEFFDPLKFTDYLTGTGNLDIKDVKIKDLNILKVILDKIPSISDLNKRIEDNLPERLKEKLKGPDTNFEKVTVDLSLEQGDLFFKNAEVATTEFKVFFNGKMDLDNNLNIKSDFFIGKDLSKNLVEAVEEFSCLMDANGQIYINLKEYSGNASDIRIYPDAKDLVSRMGRCQLKNVIRKAIGTSGEAQEKTSSDSVLVPVFDGKKMDVDPIIDKALDIFNNLF